MRNRLFNRLAKPRSANFSSGFTVIEIIVVVVVISILSVVVVLNYSNWQRSAITAQIKSDLNSAAAAMENARTFSNSYPSSIPTTFTASKDVVVFGGGISGTAYCIDAYSTRDTTLHYYINRSASGLDQGVQEGECATKTIPANLAATATSSSAINLTWNAVEGATTYNLQRDIDSSFATATTIASQAGTSFTSSGLSEGVKYYFRVNSVISGTTSGWSITASTSTLITSLPAIPTNLAATSTANTQIEFSWTAGQFASSYTIQCALDTGFTSGVQSANTTTAYGSVSGLTPHKTYYCRIKSNNANGSSSWTANLTTGTTTNFGSVAAATNLNEITVGPTGSSVSWSGTTCSLGTPLYRFVWVSPYSTSTSWDSATSVTITNDQGVASTWKVESKCTFDGVDSSVATSASRTFTAAVATPTGSWGAIGWDDRFTFNANSNTFTCVGTAVKQFLLVETLLDYTSGNWTFGWTTSAAIAVTNANQGARMTTYMQVRCLNNGVSSSVLSSDSRTDYASVDAPGYVPNWCAGSCGSVKHGDRWTAVSCPAGTYGVYWSYAWGDVTGPIFGPYEAANFFGYDREGYYDMINDYLMARCTSNFRSSAWGPQDYRYY